MLADDEGIVVDSFTYILKEEFGDEVMIESAKTGRSVIELAERFRPDIALMDIRMPGINGIDAIKEIRKRNTGIIFIVISAYDKFGYAQEAINQGVMDYLNKPVDRNQLIMTVKKAMEQAKSILIRRFGGYTIQEAHGGWIDNGTEYQEYTLVILLSDTTLDQVHAAADELAEVFHQSSVLIQENPTRTEFYTGK